MFKVQKEEYTNKTFRLPIGLVKELEQLAQKEKVSLNNLVIQCCQYALDHSENVEAITPEK
ncbi:MAG: hypothetical protein IJ138_01575 [Clostridia bacterium]|nr:hypothetical protein [Clostridia bacterium]